MIHVGNRSHPWVLGSLAVYAGNIHAARQVHDLVAGQDDHEAGGKVMLDTGEEVEWVDIGKIASHPDLP